MHFVNVIDEAVACAHDPAGVYDELIYSVLGERGSLYTTTAHGTLDKAAATVTLQLADTRCFPKVISKQMSAK